MEPCWLPDERVGMLQTAVTGSSNRSIHSTTHTARTDGRTARQHVVVSRSASSSLGPGSRAAMNLHQHRDRFGRQGLLPGDKVVGSAPEPCDS